MGRFSSAFYRSQGLQKTTLVAFLAYVIYMPAFSRELVDRIVAEVSGVPILYSDVMTKVLKGPLVMVSPYPVSVEASAFDQALQDSINLELILQRAPELDIVIEDSELEQRVKAFLSGNNMSVEQLKNYLKQEGRTYEQYREDFRKQIVLMRFRGREILPRVKITDRDVEAFYLKKSGSKGSKAMEMHLQNILVKIPKGSSDEFVSEKHKLIDSIYERLQGGLDFFQAVKVYSDMKSSGDPAKPMKIRLGDLPEVIRAAVHPLKAGSFSKPLQTPSGLQIIYVQERKFIGTLGFQEKKAALEQELRNRQLVVYTKKWISEARQRSKINMIKE